MIPRPPIPTLFPYTTLFRSTQSPCSAGLACSACRREAPHIAEIAKAHGEALTALAPRSEEHTSELQSRPHLVCRLLLEKKKPRVHTCPQSKYLESPVRLASR